MYNIVGGYRVLREGFCVHKRSVCVFVTLLCTCVSVCIRNHLGVCVSGSPQDRENSENVFLKNFLEGKIGEFENLEKIRNFKI